MCNEKVAEYHEINTSKPFTATSPMEGLTVWGAYSAPKTLVCNNGLFVHFIFEATKEHRLVKLSRSPIVERMEK
jgi:hypothetical protein